MTCMLTLQRRHSSKCPDRKKGSNYLKCRGRCPLRVTGTTENGRVRLSLKTRDLQRAARRMTEMEDRISGKPRKTILDAVAAFHAQHDTNQPETKRKYKRILGYLTEFCASAGIAHVDSTNVETMDHYSLWRAKSGWAWIKEIELLRQFFEFCRDREWTSKNPARALKRPVLREANHVVPYTQKEIIRIIAACDQIGRTSYERRRARAMVLLMRYAGLRISDVVTLASEHIKGNRLSRQAVKNHQWIRVELPLVVVEALEQLPHPKAAAQDFSSGHASLRSLVKGAARTMAAVFERSGVEGAHCHRFRHTLASELLGKGGTFEEVAAILGDSPATIRRYYAKWTEEYQGRQDTLIRKIHDTNLARAEEQASKC
jgi:integrase